MIIGYNYTRYSTVEQKHGDSFTRQAESIERYAKDHGITLDATLSFQDLGTSAFHGKNATEGRLGAFIDLAERGRIKAGQYLLMERFDRLSREDVVTALQLLLKLLSFGITVVTTANEREHTTESLKNPFNLMMVVMEMTTANEESVKKSERIGKSWSSKRKRASANFEPMTSRLPAWIKVAITMDSDTPPREHRKAVLDKNGRLMLDQEKAKIVRRIFKEASQGKGHHLIAKQFNEEGVPAIGRVSTWHDSYVQKILCNDAVIGRFQPYRMTGEDRKRIPDGEPIADYFPAVIKEALYLKVRGQRSSKQLPSGPRGNVGAGNLFTKLAVCAKCDSPMHYVNKGKRGGASLVCSNAKRGDGCIYQGWNYKLFEPTILETLYTKVDWGKLAPKIEETAQTVVEELEEQHARATVERTACATGLDRIFEELEKVGASAPLTERRIKREAKLAELTARLKFLDTQLAIGREKAAHAEEAVKSASAAFLDFRMHGKANQQARDRLRVILRDYVKVIRLHPKMTKGPLKGDREFEIHLLNELDKPIRLPFNFAVELGEAIQRHSRRSLLIPPPPDTPRSPQRRPRRAKV